MSPEISSMFRSFLFNENRLPRRSNSRRRSPRFEQLEERRMLAPNFHVLKDIWPNPSSSDPRELIAVGSTLFFVADDGTSGRELWKTNGTPAGTVRVKDIRSGNVGSNPTGFTQVGGTLYFVANDGTSGSELWKTDGTLAGTVRVKDINPRQNAPGWEGPGDLTNLNGTLYFFAYDGTGHDLWKSDGTEAGTVRVKDMYPDPRSFDIFNSGLTNVNGTLYFGGDDGLSGMELWKSDGTEAGTVLVKDINIGSGRSFPGGFSPIGDAIYFSAYTSDDPNDLNGVSGAWKTDGTEAGTVLVKEFGEDAAAGGYTELNGLVYFTSSHALSSSALWKTDGTEAGTIRLKSFPWLGITGLRNLSGTLYFGANDVQSGSGLWKSDGTETGTVLVKDMIHGGDSGPGGFTNVDGTVYFRANDGTHGIELWKTDGTEAGTVLVKDFNPGSARGFEGTIVAALGKLFVVANSPQHGYELWVANLSEPPVTGDYNANGTVDAADYVVWRKTLGSNTDLRANGDNTGPSAGVIDQADYAVWRANFGKASPPAAAEASVDEPGRNIIATIHDGIESHSPSQANAATIIFSEFPMRHPAPEPPAPVLGSPLPQPRITWELALLSVLDAGQTTTAPTQDYFTAPNDDESLSDESGDYLLTGDADDHWETTLRTLANDVYSAVNDASDI
jgi:ELWxxDGT repeat protein